MPLPPLSERPASSEQRTMHARLRDIEAHLNDYTPGLVRGTDGVLYLAMATQPRHFVETEPFPHLSPSLRLPEDSTPLDDAVLSGRNAALAARLEQRIEEYGLQEITDGQITRANPITLQPNHELQVTWLGNRWRVASGGIQWFEITDRDSGTGNYQHWRIPDTDLTGTGWITLNVVFKPQPYEAGKLQGFTVQAGSITLGQQTNHLPERVVSFGATSSDYKEASKTPVVSLPIAYVEQPGTRGRVSPIIHQIATGSYNFSVAPAAEYTYPLPQHAGFISLPTP